MQRIFTQPYCKAGEDKSSCYIDHAIDENGNDRFVACFGTMKKPFATALEAESWLLETVGGPLLKVWKK